MGAGDRRQAILVECDGEAMHNGNRSQNAIDGGVAGSEMGPVNDKAVVIIGSGPAGTAAAHALCESGCRVTVIDAGDRIEAGRMAPFETLARLEPDEWPEDLARRARESFPVDIRHVPLKPAYGSLFPYARDDDDLPIACDSAETLSSLAYGGLSNSWGASILPFRRSDIAGWPITLDELEPHYRAVLRFVPLAGEHDELSEVLPLYTDALAKLRRGAQAERLLSHLRGHASTLRRSGFSFGASRLAVNASRADPRGCRLCGMCLFGCPYGSIYNSTHTLEALMRRGVLEYRGGIYVDRLTEDERSVTIQFHERGQRTQTGSLTATRVFVACGAISSTRLMLDSTGGAPSACKLQDSQYFVVPMLTASSAAVSAATQGNTLAQVFVELDDERVCAHTVHLQVYGYNDLMLAALARRSPLSAVRLERLLQPALGRLLVVQGYMHSAESPGLRIHRDGAGVRVVGEHGGLTRVRKLVRHLARRGRMLGMLPIPGLTQVGRPGKSNHTGGSLPMRDAPGELETDTLGRLRGWRRVHVVDASVLPSVPATTVTISVMANAHRIATAAVELGV
jgi:choline dehydrogenase-like flavoprotein